MEEAVKKQKLENAIQCVQHVRQQLFAAAAEAKEKASTNFTRHMETLRNREVFLRNQIDLIYHSKEDILVQQQNKLCANLAKLKIGQATIFEKGCDLDPAESAQISFQADSASLREHILSYGQVKPCYNVPTLASPSMCMPPRFEEYEDDQHHVLYKTVEEVFQAQNKSLKYEFTPVMSSLSKDSNDWLKKSLSETTMSTHMPAISFSHISNNQDQWLKHKSSTNVSASGLPPLMSVAGSNPLPNSELSFGGMFQTKNNNNMWIKQIKDEIEMKTEEEFELIDTSEDSGSSDEPHTLPDLYKPSGDNQQWLMLERSDADSEKGDAEKVNMFSGFADIKSKDTHYWLRSNSTERKNKPDSFVLEIENIGKFLSSKLWLKPPRDTGAVSKDNLVWLCQAHEPCTDASQCIGNSICALQMSSKMMATQVFELPGFSMFHHNYTDTKTWLLNEGKNVSPTTAFRSLQELTKRPPCNHTEWLKIELENQEEDEKMLSLSWPSLNGEAWIRYEDTPVPTTPALSFPEWKTMLKQQENMCWILTQTCDQPAKEIPDEDRVFENWNKNNPSLDGWIYKGEGGVVPEFLEMI